MMLLPPSPDRLDVVGASSRVLPLTAPTVAVGTDDGGDGEPSMAARGALRGLQREHARCAWPERDAGGGAAEATGPLVEHLATLRATTTRYVDRLRADGTRPEQMLVRVKAFVREAMAAEGWQDPEAVQTLTAAVVGWSIAAYYDR